MRSTLLENVGQLRNDRVKERLGLTHIDGHGSEERIEGHDSDRVVVLVDLVKVVHTAPQVGSQRLERAGETRSSGGEDGRVGTG